ncbi:MAG: sigma-54-dependent Fis family transcriptional regulator [Nitrospirae bacterium]|nr:sigma-54-dependent Fis family transcriptional regulator [Nitrospirota bacterium]MBI2891429.1 sigma-54-dependent Fis family transcriptional regulator [Nitrospirota bacterium]
MPERILIVEDDRDMLASCRQALEGAKFAVFLALSPKEAAPILQREELDLVLTDLRMPNGGGQAVIQAAHRVAPDLPVILITAYPSVESAIQAFKGGVVDYLTKPFTGDQLVDAVRSALLARQAKEHADLLRRMEPAPALSEKPEIIPHLAVRFLDALLKENPKLRVKGFSDEALDLLADQDWPGNSAELRAAVQKAVSKATGAVITVEDLRKGGAIPRPMERTTDGVSARRAVLRDYERNYLVDMLARHGGNVTYTAEALGIHRVTLQRLIKKLGIIKSSRPAS